VTSVSKKQMNPLRRKFSLLMWEVLVSNYFATPAILRLKIDEDIMVHIEICAVGKIKEKFFRDALDEYKKRLSGYCRIGITEVQDEKTPENAGESEREIILQKEGERLLKKISERDHVIALAIDGKMMSSEEMADHLEGLFNKGNSSIVFVIGGSLGLSREVLSRADEKISFSKMTFPHQLMRVILLEQIYRSFRIIKGEPYHK
jgi:23S rRNA (pseudouridine1915-N3)-methyltransferase